MVGLAGDIHEKAGGRLEWLGPRVPRHPPNASCMTIQPHIEAMYSVMSRNILRLLNVPAATNAVMAKQATNSHTSFPLAFFMVATNGKGAQARNQKTGYRYPKAQQQWGGQRRIGAQRPKRLPKLK